MARLVFVAALMVCLLVSCMACTSNSGRTPAWDLGPNTEIYPTYNDGAVGVGITHRFRRAAAGETDIDPTSEPTHREVFNLLDLDRDGQISIIEWTVEGGAVKSFCPLIADHDTNGDEKISAEEFDPIPFDFSNHGQ